MYSIYALADPRTNEVRYVGCTKNMRHRYSRHLCTSSEKSDIAKRDWIQGLKDIGLRPTLLILEKQTTKRRALDGEIYWLQEYLEREAPLTNMRDADLMPIECRTYVPPREKGLRREA